MAQPSAALTAPCADPVTFPAGPLNEGPAERYWIEDRAALVDCGTRLLAVTEFYRQRDAKLAGK